MKSQLCFYLLLCGFLYSCQASYTGTTGATTFYKPGELNPELTDSLIVDQIFPYKEKLNRVMNEVLVYSTAPMEKGQPESTLGNFVADACLIVSGHKYSSLSNGIDFCVLNNGGLRSSLPYGKITRKNVYELMPFENELVVLTLSGPTVTRLLNYISEKGGVPVANLRMKLSGRVEDVIINEQVLDTNQAYKVLTSDYLAHGGDAMEMFSNRLNIEPVGIKVRDAIISYMEMQQNRNDTLKPKLDGRISK